jgi:phosphatidate cytidylyltransferase
MKRILTASVLTAFALYSVFLSPQWIFIFIVYLMAALCYVEFAGIAKASGVEGPLWLGYLSGAAAMAYMPAVPLIVLVVLVVSMAVRDLSKALAFAATLVLATFYIFVAWRFAVPLRAQSVWWLMFALAVNWVGDIAAYYVGRAIGKHKLAPRISPGKSWEGAVASMTAAVLFGLWYGRQFHLGLDPLLMVALAAVANFAGQIGDLAESAFKRGAGVKDSGTLLPGHGGFLDRLDSTLFSLPVVHYFLLWARG